MKLILDRDLILEYFHSEEDSKGLSKNFEKHEKEHDVDLEDLPKDEAKVLLGIGCKDKCCFFQQLFHVIWIQSIHVVHDVSC